MTLPSAMVAATSTGPEDCETTVGADEASTWTPPMTALRRAAPEKRRTRIGRDPEADATARRFPKSRKAPVAPSPMTNRRRRINGETHSTNHAFQPPHPREREARGHGATNCGRHEQLAYRRTCRRRDIAV